LTLQLGLWQRSWKEVCRRGRIGCHGDVFSAVRGAVCFSRTTNLTSAHTSTRQYTSNNIHRFLTVDLAPHAI
jgi:hypothetical protein